MHSIAVETKKKGDEQRLFEVLHKLEEPSLSALVHDHEHGHLESKIAQHA